MLIALYEWLIAVHCKSLSLKNIQQLYIQFRMAMQVMYQQPQMSKFVFFTVNKMKSLINLTKAFVIKFQARVSVWIFQKGDIFSVYY